MGPIWMDQLSNSNFQNLSTDDIEKLTSKIEEADEENDKEIQELELKKEDIIALQKDLNSLNLEDKNWQQELNNISEKWKEKNPIYYFIITSIVTIVIQIVIPIYCNNCHCNTTCETLIRQEPNNHSEIISRIPQGSELCVHKIEEKNNWLKLEISTDDINESIVGWVEKNLF